MTVILTLVRYYFTINVAFTLLILPEVFVTINEGDVEAATTTVVGSVDTRSYEGDVETRRTTPPSSRPDPHSPDQDLIGSHISHRSMTGNAPETFLRPEFLEVPGKVKITCLLDLRLRGRAQ